MRLGTRNVKDSTITPDHRLAEHVVEATIAAASQPHRIRPSWRRSFTRDSIRRRTLALADVCALGAAALAVHLAVSSADLFPGAWYVLLGLPLWVLLSKVLGLYDRDANLIHKSTLDELPSLALSVLLGTALVFLFGPALGGPELARTPTIAFLGTALVLVPTGRWCARALVSRSVEAERCLIVGSGQIAQIVSSKLKSHRLHSVDLIGYIDGTLDSDDAVIDLAHLGDDRDFEAICRRHDVDRVVVTFSSLDDERLLDVIRIGRQMHIKVTVVPRLHEVIGGGVEIDQVDGLTLLGLRGAHRTTSTLALKRAIDVAGAGAGLAVLFPVLLGIAAAVKLTSPGPVLFRQPRVGRGNRPFTMFKFRTMIDGADALKPQLLHLNEAAAGPMFKIDEDPRVTRLGRLLRSASLDELPQLINVLRGEMSLVGPRPLVPDESDHLIGWNRARLDITPGLTGPWQVMGRHTIPFEEMVKMDYLYVAEWSLWNDVKLLVRTLPVMLMRTGR